MKNASLAATFNDLIDTSSFLNDFSTSPFAPIAYENHARIELASPVQYENL